MGQGQGPVPYADPAAPPTPAGRAIRIAGLLWHRLGTVHDTRCPTRRVSAATASVTLRMVAAEGLIRLEQGKRSAVLPVRVYGAEVVVPHRGAVSASVVGRPSHGRSLYAGRLTFHPCRTARRLLGRRRARRLSAEVSVVLGNVGPASRWAGKGRRCRGEVLADRL
jgi:hypothetical protein